MSSDRLMPWHVRLRDLRSRRPSHARDVALSELFDEPFDGADELNIEQLFLSFISDIDTSVLQSAENAFGHVEFQKYFASLGRCFAEMMAANPKIAIERLNFPSRELDDAETRIAFSVFAAGVNDVELLGAMRATIVEWRLLGNEPYRTFFYLSQSLEG